MFHPTKINDTRYTIFFALLVCLVCSVTLAAVSQGLQARRELNATIDQKRNILKAVVLVTPLSLQEKPADVLRVYKENISEVVIDPDGNIVEGMAPERIPEDAQRYPLYIYQPGQQPLAYCFPIEGKGLWSTLYGFLALEADAITIRGITFYQHGETPGLGAEIASDWFQNNFKGKKVWDATRGQLMPPQVFKGKVVTSLPLEQQPYYVDGISGATMTGKGVTALLEKGLNIYEPFFRKIRGE